MTRSPRTHTSVAEPSSEHPSMTPHLTTYLLNTLPSHFQTPNHPQPLNTSPPSKEKTSSLASIVYTKRPENPNPTLSVDPTKRLENRPMPPRPPQNPLTNHLNFPLPAPASMKKPPATKQTPPNELMPPPPLTSPLSRRHGDNEHPAISNGVSPLCLSELQASTRRRCSTAAPAPSAGPPGRR